MRIAMFTNNYKPFIGGVPISIERLANALRERGHIVYVFAPTYKNQVAENFVIRYKSYSKKNVEDTKFIIPNVLDNEIERKFKELKFDIIHVHQPMLIGNVAVHLSRKYHVPVVLTYHTRYEYYLHHIKPYRALKERYDRCENERVKGMEGKVLGFTKDKFVPYYMKKFINSCDYVFSPTELIKEYLMEELRVSSEIKVLPTGLEKSFYKMDKGHSEKIRKKYLGTKKYLFCTVSRLSHEKNFDFLLSGILRLKERIGDVFNVMIIGDGPQKEEIMEKARLLKVADNTIFLDSVDNKQIKNYYCAAEMFLFASKSETQGIVLLEAMAGKIPVVAVEATGVLDVVENGVNGFVTKESREEWTDKIIHLISNKGAMNICRQGAFNTAKKYSTDNIAVTAEDSYKRVVSTYCNETTNIQELRMERGFFSEV